MRRPDSKLEVWKQYVYIKEYEDNLLKIINNLSELNISNNTNLRNVINNNKKYFIEDKTISEDKINIFESSFKNTNLCMIYGPAGTGKTKTLEIFSKIFEKYNKCFIANTNTAIENLKEKIKNIKNSKFKTVSKYIWDLKNNELNESYDFIFIDECSTINDSDILKILNQNKDKIIIMAGDIYQIESIKYGKWFELAYEYFKNTNCVFDLRNIYRTEDEHLTKIWENFRKNNDEYITLLTNYNCIEPLNENLFKNTCDDEIILCLNYHGMYGINNINKIMQEQNIGQEFLIGVDIYKIGDKILFNDCPRFKGVLYNNLKGTIINIEKTEEYTYFTIKINENIDLKESNDIELIHRDETEKIAIIKFSVSEYIDDDNDENKFDRIIPFNLGYAISIHKAQGLEYNSVKIILNSNSDDMITRNIFYTAIKRAKEKLKIYCNPDCQNKIFKNFRNDKSKKDINILLQKLKDK